MKFQAIPIKKRFYSKVILPNDDGCMIWSAGKDSWGYGHLNINKSMAKAHRLSYELHYGEIPNGLLVLHKCDNPPCVAPEHLFLGTTLDNTKDCISKGRFTKPRIGENNPVSKLNVEAIRDIRKRLSNGETQQSIAKFYKISHATIYYVKNNKTWAHVKDE